MNKEFPTILNISDNDCVTATFTGISRDETDFILKNGATWSDISIAGSALINPMVYGGIPESSILSHEVSDITAQDQLRFDEILNNNFDIVSNSKLFEKVRDYEHAFDTPSDVFFQKWSRGEVIPTPEIHDWMNIYKGLFEVHGQPTKPN